MEDRSYFIEMPRDLTSYEFYTHVLPIRNEIEYKESDIILDFSRTFKVEPLVIPNLLCFGYELGIRNGNVPKIYFPDTSYSGEVKNYLNEIGFFHYANKYGLFEFCSSPYSGLTGKKIDPICGTLYFDTENTVDEINRGVELCIAPFADEYLYKFECIRSDLDQTYYVNDITEFLSEIIMNCKQHAHSFSFTTLHAKYSAKKIYISVSDFGCGFLNTIASDLYCKEYCARDWIDTLEVVETKVILNKIVNAIVKHINNSGYDDYIIAGVDLVGTLLASRIAFTLQAPLTYIVPEKEKNVNAHQEIDLEIEKDKKVILITDAIVTFNTVKSAIEKNKLENSVICIYTMFYRESDYQGCAEYVDKTFSINNAFRIELFRKEKCTYNKTKCIASNRRLREGEDSTDESDRTQF